MLHHITSGKTDDAPTQGFERLRPFLIVLNRVIMLPSIHFYDQLGLLASKVGDEGADLELATKLQAIQFLISQRLPQLSLGVARAFRISFAKGRSFRELGRSIRSPSP